MTRRRNPPPRTGRPLRPGKDKEQLDTDLRNAKVARKAESQQKNRLRRHEWDDEVEDANPEPEEFKYGDGDGDGDKETAVDDESDRG